MERDQQGFGDVERVELGLVERAGDLVFERLGQRPEHGADDRPDDPRVAHQFSDDARVDIAGKTHDAAILHAHGRRAQFQIVRA